MTWIVFLASATLACVAAAGVLRPFSRSRSVMLEALTDPLEDERSSLFRTLKDLDEERATGQLPEETYRSAVARSGFSCYGGSSLRIGGGGRSRGGGGHHGGLAEEMLD